MADEGCTMPLEPSGGWETNCIGPESMSPARYGQAPRMLGKSYKNLQQVIHDRQDVTCQRLLPHARLWQAPSLSETGCCGISHGRARAGPAVLSKTGSLVVGHGVVPPTYSTGFRSIRSCKPRRVSGSGFIIKIQS